MAAVNTRWNSCATPIAATPARPVAAWRSRWGCITDSLRSFLPNRTTGMRLTSAKVFTASRNLVPIFSTTAGEGIGNPRCCKNCTTCPGTCTVGK